MMPSKRVTDLWDGDVLLGHKYPVTRREIVGDRMRLVDVEFADGGVLTYGINDYVEVVE